MRRLIMAGVLAALAAGCGQGADDWRQQANYTPVPIDAADEPGAPRQARCQIGEAAEQACTVTPLFGDDSFQLDGEGIALRMVVTGDEGGLFEVFGPEWRTPMAGTYRRASAADPCWTSEDAAGPSTICVR